MRYFDTFTGIGGFTLAIQRALPKAKCVGFSEVDKYATQIYQHHYPNHKNYGDITKIDAETLPDFDLLVGGFPCQAFSIAGKRKGFEDTRGTLFFDLARILKAKRPRHFIFENVKGLLSHDNGRTFKTIIAALDELGYDCQWQVLNSKNHGVPQNRERVLIVGHLRGTTRPEVFPLGSDREETDELSGHLSNTLTARYYGAQGTGTYLGEGQLNAQERKIETVIPNVNQDYRVYKPRGIAPTLASNRGGGSAKHPYILQRARGKNKGGKHEIAPTMTGEAWKDNNTLGAVRRLTPTECERLQGFPDGWTSIGSAGPISDSQRYKTLGNAVTVNVVSAVFNRLIK